MITFISTMFKLGFFALRVASFLPGLVLKLVFGSAQKKHAKKALPEKKGKCCCGIAGKILFFFIISAICSVIATKLFQKYHKCKEWDDDWEEYDEDDDSCCDENGCTDKECGDDCCEDDCCSDDDCQKEKSKFVGKKKKDKRCSQNGLINILLCHTKKR